MPLEAPLAPAADRAADLNARFAHHSAQAILDHALSDATVGRTAMVSSFGADSVVLLHMLSVADRTTPVLFLDTEMLFPETLDYQKTVAEALGLTDVRLLRPDRELTFLNDSNGLLHISNPDACCTMRKTEPLARALAPFDAWITGRKRFQGGKRAALDYFETDGAERIKINPLAHFTPADIAEYIQNNRLPRHPLVARGYPSIGCAPCTTRVAPGEDPRAGRWRGRDKSECGIHIVDGKIVRVREGQTA